MHRERLFADCSLQDVVQLEQEVSYGKAEAVEIKRFCLRQFEESGGETD